MSILEVNKLDLELGGEKILQNLSLKIWEGGVHAIVGVNGAGKSTLANTIMGLSGYRNYEGEILFKGESLKDKSLDERARMGITLSWQEPARFEGLRVYDYILASSKEKNRDTVLHALDMVGMKADDYINRAVDKTLSGGERKKIELASLVAMRPSLALLDEPDSGIDIESIERIFEVVQFLRRQGTTIVFITHSLAVLQQAEHAFLLCKGQLVDEGRVERIIRYFEDECVECVNQNPEIKGEVK